MQLSSFDTTWLGRPAQESTQVIDSQARLRWLSPLPMRFTGVVVIAVAGSVVAALAAIGFVSGGSVPNRLSWGLALVANLTLLASYVSSTHAVDNPDVRERTDVLIDQLAGMLNHHALPARVSELSQLARLNPRPVALILGDLDHLKAINDEHGHATGDAVRRAAATSMLEQLRAYELAYILEDGRFLIILPGSSIGKARQIAQNLRRAVQRQDVGGVKFTISFGVSASEGGSFDFPGVLAEAERALHAAKSAGRNRVRTAGVAVPLDAATPPGLI